MTLDLGMAADQPPPDGPPLPALLEAVLMVAEEPASVEVLAERLDRDEGEVLDTLRALSAEYAEAGRGFALREIGGGWRFYTAAECAPYVERFVLAGQTARLSQAALETLAIVAYQQPVTRGRIAAVRGVNVDGVVRTLLTRKLIEEAGPDVEGGALTYRTTTYFLERMGLRDLSELPPLAPLLPGNDELAELMDPPAVIDLGDSDPEPVPTTDSEPANDSELTTDSDPPMQSEFPAEPEASRG